MKNLSNYKVIGKKVLFRADLNVPVLNGVITDYSRILAIKSSIETLIKNKNKIFNMSSGQQIRDYLSINELCKLINILVNNPNLVGIINCCSGKKLKLIQIIKKYLGKKKYF